MKMLILLIAVAAGLLGCGGDTTPPPVCQTATVAHPCTGTPMSDGLRCQTCVDLTGAVVSACAPLNSDILCVASCGDCVVQ